MDEDTLNAAMRILNMAKVLESHGKLNRLMDMLGDCTEITWDNQCMVERFACESVFQNTKCYEQCGKQVSHHAYEPDREVYVLRDPLLDRFHALCREYESRRGITRIEHSLFGDVKTIFVFLFNIFIFYSPLLCTISYSMSKPSITFKLALIPK